MYDERWRVVAEILDDNEHPNALYVHHAAGLDGRGTGSYIDALACRERGYDAAGEEPIERVYYCQNRHADVVAIVSDTGALVEQARYSSYGVPFGLSAGDADSDGDVDSGDVANIQIWAGLTQYDVRGDLDLDGDVDSGDNTLTTALIGTTLGRGVLSRDDVMNRCGYAGYRFDEAVLKYHVRNRGYDPWLGRWLNRDPIEYQANSANLYEYVLANPLVALDPAGLEGVLLPDPMKPWRTPPADPDVTPLRPPGWTPPATPSGPSIVFYNPDVETWYGWNYATSMANAQYDCPFEAKSMQDMIDGLRKWKEDHPGEVPSKIGIIDHGSPGIPLIGEDAIIPGSPQFNDFMSMVDAPCCIDFEHCNVGEGPEGKDFKDRLKKYYPNYEFDVNSGTCIVLPGGGSFVTPGWWKRGKWKLRDGLPWF